MVVAMADARTVFNMRCKSPWAIDVRAAYGRIIIAPSP
jgi:hypothetical protein